MHPHSSSLFSVFPTAPAPPPAPPLSSSSVRGDGERKDDGSGAREEGEAKAKGKKSSRGGSSSRSGLPCGWIRSTISQDDLDDLAEEGLIPHGSARLPEDETEPRPREGDASSLPLTSTVDFLCLRILFSGFVQLFWCPTSSFLSQHYHISRRACLSI